jgi:putative flippase GtrA
MSNTFVRFVIVGLGNTCLGLFVAITAGHYFSPITANLIAYVVVVPISYLSHRSLSFLDRGDIIRSFARYLLVIAFGYLGNLAALNLLLHLNIPVPMAQAGALTVHVASTYLMTRFFVFLRPA